MQDDFDEDLCKILGENVKLFRMKRDLRQTDLAEIIGITVNTISNIERGFGWIEYKNLVSIMNTLGMRSYDLFAPNRFSYGFKKGDEKAESLTEGEHYAAEDGGNGDYPESAASDAGMNGKHH